MRLPLSRLGNATQAAWLNAFAALVLSGSALASVTFWAMATSCLVCSPSVSNCLRACSIESSMKAEGDFMPDNFSKKPKAA